MTRATVGDWSTTAASNTSVDGSNTDENCVASGVNNAMRSMMAANKGALTAVASSGTDTYTATLAPAPDAYATGQIYLVRIATANTSTTPTLNLNGLGAKTIVQTDGSTALLAGDLNGVHWFEYDGTNFRVLNPIKYAGTAALAPVIGPASSTDGDVALFSGTSGALLKDAGFTVAQAWRGFLGGLVLSNDSGTPNTIIDIAAGSCMSDDNTTIMSAAAITKTTGSWAVGTGNGGLDTGSVANSTWYHVYIIERTDTGVVDALISTSASSPTMPSNYTKKRRIGSFKTDGSAHILAFTQHADAFWWGTPPAADLNGTTTTANRTLTTISVPTGVIVEAIVNLQASSATNGNMQVLLTDPANADVATATGATPLGTLYINAAASTNIGGQARCWTNTSAQIGVRASNATDTVRIVVTGWVDPRGRFT